MNEGNEMNRNKIKKRDLATGCFTWCVCMTLPTLMQRNKEKKHRKHLPTWAAQREKKIPANRRTSDLGLEKKMSE